MDHVAYEWNSVVEFSGMHDDTATEVQVEIEILDLLSIMLLRRLPWPQPLEIILYFPR